MLAVTHARDLQSELTEPGRQSQSRCERVVLAVIAMLVAAQAGCVTERLPRAAGTSPYIKRDVPPPNPSTGDAITPGIVKPAPGGLRFEIAQLGEVPFDSSTLPLVSPGGNFMAVQAGSAPPLDAMRASGPAEALNTRIEIYDIRGRRLAQTFIAGPAARRGVPSVLTQGMLLGRGVNAEGFLIEWPREDTTRWIGLCKWSDASVTWLIGGDESVPTYAAHAVLLDDGTLITALGDDQARGWLLAQRSPTGEMAVLDNEPATMLAPLSSLDARRFVYLRLNGGSLTLNGAPTAASPRGPQLLDLGVNRTLDDLLIAMSPGLPPGAAVPAIFRAGSGFMSDFAPATLFFHPEMGRIAWYWIDGSNAVKDLGPGVISAAPTREGLVLTTSGEMTFLPVGSPGTGGGNGVKLNLARKPGVIRGIWDGGFCVVEPGKAGAGVLSVSKFTHPTLN